jgi:DNA-binding transcriptional LysR family regulator
MLDAVSLDQLRVFQAICETRSFSAAARRLRRAQSAVSHAVASLEAALGVALFDRSGRMPTLTAAGLVLADDARAVIARVEEMKGRANSIAQHIEPALAVAVDAFMPRTPLICALHGLEQQFPHLPITLFTEALGGVEERLLNGSSTLGIVCGWLPTASDTLERRFLVEVEMVSVVAATHPLAALNGPVSRAVLQDHRQLVLADSSSTADRHQGGVISNRIWRFADLPTRHAFLLAGFGWCNMPLHLVNDDLQAGRLRRIVVAEQGELSMHMPLALVHVRGREPGVAARWFVDRLGEAIEGLFGPPQSSAA